MEMAGPLVVAGIAAGVDVLVRADRHEGSLRSPQRSALPERRRYFSENKLPLFVEKKSAILPDAV